MKFDQDLIYFVIKLKGSYSLFFLEGHYFRAIEI